MGVQTQILAILSGLVVEKGDLKEILVESFLRNLGE